MNKTIAIFSLSLFAALYVGYSLGTRMTILRFQNVSLAADRLIETTVIARALKGITDGEPAQTQEFLSGQLARQAFLLDDLLETCPDEASRKQVRRGLTTIAFVAQSVPLKTGFPETQTRLDRILKAAIQDASLSQ